MRKLIENQLLRLPARAVARSVARVVAPVFARSVARVVAWPTPPGGGRGRDSRPWAPTPFTIFGNPEGENERDI